MSSLAVKMLLCLASLASKAALFLSCTNASYPLTGALILEVQVRSLYGFLDIFEVQDKLIWETQPDQATNGLVHMHVASLL